MVICKECRAKLHQIEFGAQTYWVDEANWDSCSAEFGGENDEAHKPVEVKK